MKHLFLYNDDVKNLKINFFFIFCHVNGLLLITKSLNYQK